MYVPTSQEQPNLRWPRVIFSFGGPCFPQKKRIAYGVAVPANPTAAYTVPDLSINNTGSIPVVISTTNIPNTTINLYVSTEPGTADSVTPVTLTNGTGTPNITLAQGVSRFVVRATW